MLLCAITDRRLLGADAATQRAALVHQARLWAEQGVALVQLREKDLLAPEQIALARAMQRAMRSSTKLILNAPIETALAAGADGVHLPADQAEAGMRTLRGGCMAGADSLWMSVSCHSLAEVERARDGGADCILFAPIFGKTVASTEPSQRTGETANTQITLPGVGLDALAAACKAAHPVPVLALGGVTAENAAACLAAGAAGIAAIRLFHGPVEGWHALCAASQPAQRQTW
jgi:thiamine-phosphate pyrophosphorylase